MEETQKQDLDPERCGQRTDTTELQHLLKSYNKLNIFSRRTDQSMGRIESLETDPCKYSQFLSKESTPVIK